MTTCPLPHYTSPSQPCQYANMGLSVYSSPYYHSPFSYEESPTAALQIPPTRLPHHDYELEPSPSTSYSEIIPTPPSVQTAAFDFMEPAYPRTLTRPPNTAMGTEIIYYERPAISEGYGVCMVQHRANGQTLPHPMPHPHEVLDCPLTTGFVSPFDTLPGPWVPNRTAFPASQSSPKLHQPRPSRRIPIVDLDELASACETSPSLQGTDHIRSESYAPCASHQLPKQLSARLYPISEPFVKQGESVTSEERVLLYPCGCMESSRLP
jgi:hypothetical protein